MVNQEGGRREGNSGYLFYANTFRKFDLAERQIQADRVALGRRFQHTRIMSSEIQIIRRLSSGNISRNNSNPFEDSNTLIRISN